MDSKIINEGARVLQEEIAALERLKSNLNGKFEEAVKTISEAGKVIVTGVGKSGMIARKIAATLSSVGIPAVFIHPVDALHGDLGLVSENDAAIMLSKSGSTEEIVRLIPYMKMRKAKIIAIAGSKQSLLSRSSDVALNASVEREACPFNLAPTSSSLAALALGDALAMASIKVTGFNMEDFSRLHPLGQLGRNISMQVKDIMHFGENLPLIDSDTLFREAVIEISDKKLGCVCVTEGDEKLKGIITDGDVRRIFQRFEDLNHLKTTDVMTADPVTVTDETYLSEALALMENRESQIAVLPVVDGGNKCIGVIRLHDIIRSGM